VAVGDSMQLLEGVKTPVELVVNITVPVGVMTVPGEVSVTVAVQVVDWVTVTGVLQLTEVEVVRGFPVTDPLLAPLLVLAAWTVLPL
jgi:hypothetical protein